MKTTSQAIALILISASAVLWLAATAVRPPVPLRGECAELDYTGE